MAQTVTITREHVRGFNKAVGLNNATFTTGFEVWIDNVVSGKTYTPTTGTVTADDLEITSGATFSPGANNVTLHGSYKNSGTLTVSQTVTADVLIVAGGGAGGNWCGTNNNGGGGAGGVVYAVNQVLGPGSYSVTVGDGGKY